MSDESHELLRLARENYGWIGVSLTFCTLIFKPGRRVAAWCFGWIYRPFVVIERLTGSVEGLTRTADNIANRLETFEKRLFSLESVALAAADIWCRITNRAVILLALLLTGCATPRPVATWQADETWTHLGRP